MNEILPRLADGKHMRECIVFGGSFNPPTMAHVASIEALTEQYPDLPVLVMPSADRTDKPNLGSEEERLTMLKLAAHDRDWSDQVIVTDFELKLPRPSMTYQTVKALGAAGVEKVHFVLGVDSVNTIHSWEDGDKLLEEVSWVIIRRDGYELAVEPTAYEWIELPSQDGLSSTMVREAVAQGMSLSKMVTPSVETYIDEHNLYKEQI